MSNMDRRLRRLEHAHAGVGGGCRACAGPVAQRLIVEDYTFDAAPVPSRPQPERCGACGRELTWLKVIQLLDLPIPLETRP